MCGFIGAIGEKDVATPLLECLKSLEHPDFYSTGILISHANNHASLESCRIKINDLELSEALSLPGNIGIGNHFWATSERMNPLVVQPHIIDGDIGLVQNGVIRNYEIIRGQLFTKGYTLDSECDVELIGQLVHHHLQENNDFLTAIRNATKELDGNFAITFLRRSDPEQLVALHNGSMLVLGLGAKTNFIASDPLALLSIAQQLIYLEEGDIAEVKYDSVTIYDINNKKVERQIHTVNSDLKIGKQKIYPHIMLKDIYEQPDSVLLTLQRRLTYERAVIDTFGEGTTDLFKRVHSVQIVASDASYHTGLIGKDWLEIIAGIPCQIEMATTYRARKKTINPNELFVALSQTGEDPDTLASLRQAKNLDYVAKLAICNTPKSTLVYESDLVMTNNVSDSSDISIKDFTTQLSQLFLLAVALER